MTRREDGNSHDSNAVAADEGPDGIDAEIAAHAKAHAAETDKKRYDYSVKDGYEGFSVAGMRTLGSAAGSDQGGAKKREKRAAERAFREALLEAFLERLDARLEEIDAQVQSYETRLLAEFGDDFLEVNARMYLGDEMSDRPAGLSDDQWQALLRRQLEAKMLKPDGSVKAEYAHLDIAQWLHWRSERDRVAELRDEAIDYLETTEDPPGVQAQRIAKLELDAKVSSAVHAEGSLSAVFEAAAVREQAEAVELQAEEKNMVRTSNMGFDLS